MSKLEKFESLLQSNADAQKEVAKVKAANEKKAQAELIQEMCAVANKYGVELSQDDFKESISQLEEEELANVSGGVGCIFYNNGGGQCIFYNKK